MITAAYVCLFNSQVIQKIGNEVDILLKTSLNPLL